MESAAMGHVPLSTFQPHGHHAFSAAHTSPFSAQRLHTSIGGPQRSVFSADPEATASSVLHQAAAGRSLLLPLLSKVLCDPHAAPAPSPPGTSTSAATTSGAATTHASAQPNHPHDAHSHHPLTHTRTPSSLLPPQCAEDATVPMSRSTTVATHNTHPAHSEAHHGGASEGATADLQQRKRLAGQQGGEGRKRGKSTHTRTHSRGGRSVSMVSELIEECVRRSIESCHDIVRVARELHLERGLLIRPRAFADLCSTVAMGVEYRHNKAHNSAAWEGGSEHVCGPLTDRFDAMVAERMARAHTPHTAEGEGEEW